MPKRQRLAHDTGPAELPQQAEGTASKTAQSEFESQVQHQAPVAQQVEATGLNPVQ